MTETKLTPAEVASMYEEMPGTDIHAQTGLKYWQIYAALRSVGAEVKPRGRRPVLKSPGKDELEKLFATGYSQQGVATLFGVSKRTVQRWLGK
jgi:hypothetical protein